MQKALIHLNIWILVVLSVVLATLIGVCAYQDKALKKLRQHNKRLQKRNRRMEEQLLQSQHYEAVGIMAGSIVHNLNNLMSVILGHTRMVSHDLVNRTEAAKDLQHVLKAGTMASDLLSEISDFSRQAEQALKPTDMAIPVRDTLKFLRDITPSNIRIRENLPSACEPVLASSTGLQQILMNVISNSVQAIGKGTGLIEVILRDSKIEHINEAVPRDLYPGHYVRLTIRDNGPGMKKNYLAGIQQAHRVSPPDTTCVGLGLNTVFRILEKHKGGAIISSNSGHGTSFDIFLPKIAWSVDDAVAPALITPEIASTPEPLETTQGLALVLGGLMQNQGPSNNTPPPAEEMGTVLLVDDEEMVARVTAVGLQRQGYRVIKHLDSRKALSDFLQTPEIFDVVITDQIMPHMSGVRLARKIHEARPEIPVILITGVRDSFNDQQTMEAGISQIVLKPISHRDLAEVVEKVRLKSKQERG